MTHRTLAMMTTCSLGAMTIQTGEWKLAAFGLLVGYLMSRLPG